MSRIELNTNQKIRDTQLFWAQITSIDTANDTADIVEIDKQRNPTAQTYSNVPIYYHCEENPTENPNGSLEGGSSAFETDDYVVCMRHPLKVLSHLDEIKPCSSNKVILRWYDYNVSKELYLVWDIELDKVVNYNFVNQGAHNINEAFYYVDLLPNEKIKFDNDKSKCIPLTKLNSKDKLTDIEHSGDLDYCSGSGPSGPSCMPIAPGCNIGKCDEGCLTEDTCGSSSEFCVKACNSDVELFYKSNTKDFYNCYVDSFIVDSDYDHKITHFYVNIGKFGFALNGTNNRSDTSKNYDIDYFLLKNYSGLIPKDILIYKENEYDNMSIVNSFFNNVYYDDGSAYYLISFYQSSINILTSVTNQIFNNIITPMGELDLILTTSDNYSWEDSWTNSTESGYIPFNNYDENYIQTYIGFKFELFSEVFDEEFRFNLTYCVRATSTEHPKDIYTFNDDYFTDLFVSYEPFDETFSVNQTYLNNLKPILIDMFNATSSNEFEFDIFKTKVFFHAFIGRF